MGSSQSTGTGGQGTPGQYPASLQKYTAQAGQFATEAPAHLQKASEGLGQVAKGLATTGDATRNIYNLVMANTAQQQGTTGGGSPAAGYFGGDIHDDPSKAMKEYRGSVSAASKDRLVHGLGQALKRAGIDVDPDASVQEIARTLSTKLPDPRKGKTFSSEAKAQEKACRTIADVLNDEFSPGAREDDKLIDVSLGAVSICRQVAEIVHSLATGLHTEFLEVHASLTRVLRNLEVLDEVLRGLYGQITEQIAKAPDLGVGAEKKLSDFEVVYERALRERERQMLLLRNFLDVTLAPAKEELAIAMQSEDEAHEIIQRLQLVPGTGEFADTLAMAVSGLGTVATISARVDKALKEVGLGVETYLKSADMESLERALDEKLYSGEVDQEVVGSFLKAVQTLKENFYRRDELKFTAPAAAEMEAEIGGAGDRRKKDYRGGAPEEKSTLDRRVETRKMERKLIVKEFIDKSTRHYDSLLKAVQELGPHLGKEVPLSDKLEDLRNALARLGQSRLGAINLELALIGYFRDAPAREKKELFLADLRLILAILDEVMGMEMYRGSSQYFAAMRSAIDNLVRTVDFYSDVIAKKYGGETGEAEAPAEAVEGGQVPEELAALPEIARSAYDLDRAINTFLYFYYVAKVRANLRQTHKELEFYGEKYNDILGDAVASRLRQLDAEKATRLAGDPGGAPLGGKAKEFIDAEYKCKTEFYRALEALDLYMKAFTDGIVSHPDEVKDVKRMLDGVTVIGRWFVEDTGDDIAAAFDMMPYDHGGAANAAQKPDITTQDGEHYYEKVAASTAQGNLFVPGIPQLAVPADDADAIKRQISKIFDNFQALKNITNAFVRIGEKFGGRELRRQVFMSPTQIYKALLEYMKNSALSIGVPQSAAAIPPAAPGAAGWVSPQVTLPAGPVDVAPVALRETGVYFGSVRPEISGDFATEDRYFSFCVKAMAAKVLTVIGVFDLFERPSPVYELTPTRMIIGGDEYDAIPEVIPEASELYFRLPRLAEFYKDLFAFDTGAAAAATQISMLPEMEGVFSGLIRQIFQRVEAGAARSGDYSDLEIRALVREINTIYENFRGSEKGSVISEALSSFVMEINRRYGIVKKAEWETLQKLLRESRRFTGDLQPNKTNYAILPGEEEYETERRAPSDRYLGPGAAAEARLPGGKFDIDDSAWTQWQMLTAFREKLDGFFAEVAPEDFTTYSFSTVIRQAQLELRRTEGADKRITIATQLIQGSGGLAGIDVGKTFMFHETVVVGLNTLSAVYTILAGMRQRLIDLDVVELRDTIKAWFSALPQAAASIVDQATIQGAITNAPAAKGFTARAREYVIPNGQPFQGRAGTNSTTTELYGPAQVVVQAAPPTAEFAETVASYSLDNQRIMGDLLMLITGLTTTFQGLVQTRFPGTAVAQVHLDFSGLRSLVQQLLDDVRYFMDLFRPHIAKPIIDKFESRENRGSLYWLEENLLDKLVRGLPEEQEKTLEWFSRKVNTVYTTLVGYQRYSLANIPVVGVLVPPTPGGANYVSDGGAVLLPAAANPQYYEQYGRLLCRMIYYDATRPNSGVQAAAGAYGGGIGGLISATRPRAAPGVAPAVDIPLTTGAALADRRLELWSIQGGLLPDRSVLFAFNQLMAKYIRVFYDAASGKIYRNLIDGFANGAFSRAVMTPGQSMPDLAAAGAGAVFGIRGDPTANGVLLESLALIFQRLATDISPGTQISDHLVATLSEIPLYVRESYRANLPVFIKMFELVQKEGELVKQFLNQTTIQAGRTYTPAEAGAAVNGAILAPGDKVVLGAGAVVTDAASNSYVVGSTAGSLEPLAGSPGDSDGVKALVVRVVDAVAAGCYSISNAAAEVLRELADEALYLQTQENSIQEYKARYGQMPLMPLSSVFTFLRDLTPNDSRLMPEHSVGDESFKFMYGTRKLLGRPTSKFTLADAPGVQANLESYNASATSREKIDPGRYEDFLTHITTGLRFIVDTRNYRGILAPIGGRGTPLRPRLVLDVATPANTLFAEIIATGPDANAVYSVRVTPQNTISVTESSFQDQELRKIGNTVGGAGRVGLGRDRRVEWVMNIIDMNIIPINVHALMRGIPLAPLYNYVYTFEQMVCLMFGTTVKHMSDLDIDAAAGNGVRNTRQMLLKLLVSPYEEVPLQSYGNSSAIHAGEGANGLVWRIFRGDDSLMMGRPKFLSDQVFNKPLFGTMIDTPYNFDETGPPGAGRMAAGYRPGAAPSPGVLPTAAGPVAPGTQAQWQNIPGAPTFTGAPVPQRLPRPGVRANASQQYGALTYLGQPEDNDPSTALKQVQMGVNATDKMTHLEAVGKLRFDTRMVRNLFFVTNVQRVMRLKLNQELTQYRNVLVSNHSVVNPGVTEYGFAPPEPSLTAEQGFRFIGPNETARDREYDSDRRYVQ